MHTNGSSHPKIVIEGDPASDASSFIDQIKSSCPGSSFSFFLMYSVVLLVSHQIIFDITSSSVSQAWLLPRRFSSFVVILWKVCVVDTSTNDEWCGSIMMHLVYTLLPPTYTDYEVMVPFQTLLAYGYTVCSPCSHTSSSYDYHHWPT